MDPESRELRKYGLKIRMPAQAFRTLACLLERSGELVTRDELCSRLWPDGTHVDFEGNLNAIIRDVREVLGDSARNPRFIETELKRGYRFIAPVAVVEPPAAPAGPSEITKPGRRIPVAAAVLGFAALAAWLLWVLLGTRPRDPFAGGIRIAQLTNFVGAEGHPTFSPDGTRIAFHWNGDERGGFEIYVKQFGSDTLLRLTNNPADDRSPAWSPDGRDIAFLRDLPDQSAIMLVPAVGGAERQVTLVPSGASIAWSPDGRWIAYSASFPDYVRSSLEGPGIYAVSLETGGRIRITSPGREFLGDEHPAFSPDGRKLAFFRSSSIGSSDLYVVDVSRELKPAGEPRRLTYDSRDGRDPVWTRDGRQIVFSSTRTGIHSLWRIAVSQRGDPIPVGGEEAFEPAIDFSGMRIAYSRLALVDSLTTIGLCNPECGPQSGKRLMFSAKLARNPEFSPDGRRIAFESSRSGDMEIWVCDSDGSNARQLSAFKGPVTGTPRWSPDGTRLVFDSRVQGKGKVFVMPVDGGQARQLTYGSAEDIVPNWSHDGRWIYFVSNRTGRFQVWRMASDGTAARAITKGGGFYATESYDGKLVYYAKEIAQTSLWQAPVTGGVEKPVIERLGYWLNYSVTPDGIYFVPPSAGSRIPIRFLDTRTGKFREVASTGGLELQGLSVSPDRRTLVFSKRESVERDLMLAELGK